ncbi:hypothetical protein ACFVGY_14090 [Streptomyces sp. NPDC127106]|uniref:hypothetical protein n=1 Tax=Streptomyces sp. NPDC127106 TaxID=3345360 RepID=UPI00363CD945
MGIPRLQDLAYVEVALLQVAQGATFEQVRRALVDRAAGVAREGDTDGSYSARKWEMTRSDTKKYVHNTVDVLKELMRLGWVERHILPSGPNSAYVHADSVFSLTPAGGRWAALVADDRRAAYNALTGVLLSTHPQFEGFLRLLGARPESGVAHLTIPLLRFSASEYRSNATYLDDFVRFASEAVAQGTLGWVASPQAISEGVRGYVRRIEERARAREKELSRKQFAATCEEAMARLVFTAAGCPLDYISLELLRRWTRFLGLANFSYYAPGPSAMRLWSTALVTGTGASVEIRRRVGREVRRAALDTLWAVWREQRSDAAGGMYLPVWQLRAAVCWKQRISDDEFDLALREALAGEHPGLGLRIHLDQAWGGGGAPARARPPRRPPPPRRPTPPPPPRGAGGAPPPPHQTADHSQRERSAPRVQRDQRRPGNPTPPPPPPPPSDHR